MEDSKVFDRIFDKLDKYDDRLNTTCNTITEIKTTLTDFIQAVNKKELQINLDMEKRYKNMTVLFGSITCISAVIGISKTLGLI